MMMTGGQNVFDDINHPFGPLMHVHSLSICTMCACMRVHNKRVSHACLFFPLYITLPTTNCSTTRNTWTPDPIYLYLTFTENCFSQARQDRFVMLARRHWATCHLQPLLLLASS